MSTENHVSETRTMPLPMQTDHNGITTIPDPSGDCTFMLDGPIEMEMATELRRSLITLQPWFHGRKVTLTFIITTFGGSVLAAHRMYNLIYSLRDRFNTLGVVDVVCMSAGIYPLLACTTRECYENARFLLHRGSTYVETNFSHHDEVQDIVHNVSMTKALSRAIIIKHTKLNETSYEKYNSDEKNIDARLAMQLGLVHRLKK